MKTAVTVIHLIVCISLAIVILAQPAKVYGLSAAIGGSGSGDTFFGKNKGRTYEGKMQKLTIALAIAFVITTIALSYVSNL